jgi:hypothetical protein
MKDNTTMSQNLNLGDSCCCGSLIPGSRRISFPDGSQVGIIGLDAIMEELYREGKPVDATTALEMFERLRKKNYISPSAQNLYQQCLLLEYKHFYEKITLSKRSNENHG